MSPRVLVTAPSGALGSLVIHELVSHRGYQVFAGVRNVHNSSHLVTAGATPIHLDLHDPASFGSALAHCDVLVLITPSPLEKVFDATEGLAEAVKKQNRKIHIVRVSLAGSRPDCSFEWGRSHGKADQLLANLPGAENVTRTIIHSSPTYQSFLGLHKWSLDSEGSLYAPLSDSEFVLVDARDVARAITKAIEVGFDGKVRNYLITGPQALSGEDIVSAIGEVKGVEGRYQQVTDKAARHGMTGAGLSESLVIRIEGLHQAYRRGEFTTVSDDYKKLVGKDPISWKDFVKREFS